MVVRFNAPNIQGRATLPPGAGIADAIARIPDNLQRAWQNDQQRQIAQARQSSLADLPRGPVGQPDYAEAARRLGQAGDMEGARSFATLALAQSDRSYRQQRDTADDQWRREQADRAQANADRSFASQQDQARLNRIPAGYEPNPQGGVRPMQGGPQDTNAIVARRAKEAVDAGLQPGSMPFKAYLLTGKIPENMGQPTYGVQPQFGVDAQGNPVLLQLSNNGTAAQTQLPPGVTLSRAPIKIDAGTHFELIDPVTRQVVSTIPKDVAGQEQAKAVGKAQGQAQAALPDAVGTAQQILATINGIKTDNNLSWGTGVTSVFNSIPGTSSYDFAQKVGQLRGQAFLQAFNSLRGGGQITEVEGEKATNAIARLSTAQSEGAFRQALDDLEGVVKNGLLRAAMKAGQKDQGQLPQGQFSPGSSLGPSLSPSQHTPGISASGLTSNPSPGVGGSIPGGSPSDGLPRIQSPQDLQALPSGARFIAPDGSVRVKP